VNRKLSVVLAAIVLSLLVVPVRADGATQVSGIGYFDVNGECDDIGFEDSDFAAILTGDLEGCFYVFVETMECRPSGTYFETGIDIYVDDKGTFVTPYHFTAKYEDCPNWAGEKFGRCHHPIEQGTGVYEGVTGRLEFRDDVEAGEIPYRGHLKGWSPPEPE
jgi:hypothetical protein